MKPLSQVLKLLCDRLSCCLPETPLLSLPRITAYKLCRVRAYHIKAVAEELEPERGTKAAGSEKHMPWGLVSAASRPS